MPAEEASPREVWCFEFLYHMFHGHPPQMVAGNWKSNGTVASVRELVSVLNSADVPPNVEVGVGPSKAEHVASVSSEHNLTPPLRSSLHALLHVSRWSCALWRFTSRWPRRPSSRPYRCVGQRASPTMGTSQTGGTMGTTPTGGTMRTSLSGAKRLTRRDGGAALRQVGAQDVSVSASGAFTGSISAEALADSGVKWTLVGHSERRDVRAASTATAAHHPPPCTSLPRLKKEINNDSGRGVGDVLCSSNPGAAPQPPPRSPRCGTSATRLPPLGQRRVLSDHGGQGRASAGGGHGGHRLLWRDA